MTDTFAITEDELRTAAWRGVLYSLIGSAITAVIFYTMGAVFEELFLATLFSHGIIGFASGRAMHASFEYPEQLPSRVLAVLFTLFGILALPHFIFALFATFDLGNPLIALSPSALFQTTAAQLTSLPTLFAMGDPLSALFALLTPIIGCAIAWKSVTPSHDDD